MQGPPRSTQDRLVTLRSDGYDALASVQHESFKQLLAGEPGGPSKMSYKATIKVEERVALFGFPVEALPSILQRHFIPQRLTPEGARRHLGKPGLD